MFSENLCANRTRNANVHPAIKNTPAIRIHQHRPSFSIQLLLRLTGTPHLVFNSPSAFDESNGPLPTVTDLECKATAGSTLCPNRISGCLNYLLCRQRSSSEDFKFQSADDIIDLVQLSKQQKVDRTTLISQCHELSLIQKSLKYGHKSTWEGLYKKQSMTARLYPNGNPNEMETIGLKYPHIKLGLGIFTWFHIWAESIIARKEIASDSLGRLLLDTDSGSIGDEEVDITKAVALSRQAYNTLNWKLGQSATGNLLETEKLSLVDILLFDHLAEALCNVHLVTVIADYDRLVEFFQTTYEKYFGKQYLQTKSQSQSQWIKWNDNVNALNQFNRIPFNDVEKKIRDNLQNEGYQDAFKIMQSMALHCRDLKGLLADAAQLRKQEEKIYGEDSVPKSIKGRWLQILRLGGEMNVNQLKTGERSSTEKNKDDGIANKNNELLKEALRKAKQNDELWISATLCAAILSLVMSLSAGEK